MNVEGVSSAGTQLQSESDIPQVTSSKSAGSQSVSQDRATLQSGTSSVQSLAAAALQSPQVRQDQVDSLRESVQGNGYQIDTNRLAAAISGSGGR
jgi:anti-sigma28 factor (negative regulator of flagellin synthesis)